jgi:hypothetical protein
MNDISGTDQWQTVMIDISCSLSSNTKINCNEWLFIMDKAGMVKISK